MKKVKRNITVLGLGLISLIFTLCNHDPDGLESITGNSTAFTSVEYTIPAANVQERLNIEPHYIHSDNAAVVAGEIKSGSIVLTSKGKGRATVIVGDTAGLSNSARIEVEVEANGSIKPYIHRFEGNPVKAVIKEDIVISGTVNSPIRPATVRLMMDNSDFTEVTIGKNAFSWIANLPQGLSVKISSVQGGDHPHEVNLTVSGTPLAVYTGIVAIIIPAENTTSSWPVYVTSKEGAKIQITE